MAQRISRKQLKQDEIADAVGEAGHWLERHWQRLLKYGTAAVAVVSLVVGWQVWSRHRQSAAAESLAAAITGYEQALAGAEPSTPELEKALIAFGSAADEAGRTPTGAVARFYRGAALYHLGRADEAIGALRESADDAQANPTLAATARGMLARALVRAGQPDQAVALLEQAIADENAAWPPDLALIELGRVHDAAGHAEQARAAWQRVLDDFPTSVSAAEARRLLGAG